MTCVYYNDGSYTYAKHHETRCVNKRHICCICFAQDGKLSTHTADDCKQNTQKIVELFMATVHHNGPV